MKIVIQRVSSASLRINKEIFSHIEKGLVVFLGIHSEDTLDDIQYLIKKIVALRIFSDGDGKMNLSVHDVKGDLLVISQFTLYAQTKKGNRPSFIDAATPEIALPLYHDFLACLQQQYTGRIETGEFGADMQITLCNDGPITIIIDSKEKKAL